MQKLTRRDMLTVGVASLTLGTAGCSSEPESSGGDGGREEITDTSIEIGEDEYQYWSFELTRSATLEYDFVVREGPEIDFILMVDSEFDHYQSQDRYEYLPDGSAMASVGEEVSMDLPEDDYVLVADNTTAGEASPPTNLDDDVAHVEVSAFVTD